MDVNNKGFPNETQNRKHSILKIVYMLAIMLMATSGFVILSNNIEVNAKCSVTGGDHTYGSWQYRSNNNGTHYKYRYCTSCTTHLNANSGTKDCSYSGNTCSLCGYTKPSTHTHSWNSATCTSPKTCSTCGATDGSALGHTYDRSDGSNYWTPNSDGSTHSNTCRDCNYKKNYTWNCSVQTSATCTSSAKCKCGREMDSALGHDWSSTYTKTKTDHYKKCSRCSNTTSYGTHSGNPCSICGYLDETVEGEQCTSGKCWNGSEYKSCGCNSATSGSPGGCYEGDYLYTTTSMVSATKGSKTYYKKTIKFTGCHGHSCRNESVTVDVQFEDIDYYEQIAPHTKQCTHVTGYTPYWANKFTCKFCSAGHTGRTAGSKVKTTAPDTITKSSEVYYYARSATGDRHYKAYADICSNCNAVLHEYEPTEYCSFTQYTKNSEKTYGVRNSRTGSVTTFKTTNNDTKNNHITYCSVCGYGKVEPHSFGSWSTYTSTATQHSRTRTCSKCGYVDKETNNHDAGTGNSLGKTRTGDWTIGNETNHTAKATETFKKCDTCGYQKAANTNATVEEAHNSNGRTVNASWSSNADTHWKNVALYCTVCTRSRGSTTESNGSHKNWTNRHGDSGWNKGASSSTQTYYMNCGVCNYEKQFTEVCKHNGTTNASWKYGDWNIPSWTVATSSTADTPSTRTKTRTCAGCGYVDSANETCNHTGTNGYGSWIYESWNVATSSASSTPSTRNKKRTCQTCNYTQKGTDTCNHDGTFGSYSAWTSTGAWTTGEAQSTRPQKRTCSGCAYVQTGTETCNHSGKIVYDQISNNDVQHTKRCSYCTWNKLDNHIWKDASVNNGWKQTNNTNHTRECTLCGYIETKLHNWGDWVQWGSPSNAVTHQSTCADCKLTKTENHKFTGTTTWDNYDTGYHYDKCQTTTCGYIRKEQHILTQWSNDNPSDNNQVVPSLTGTHTHHCTQQSYGTGCGYSRTEAHNWVKVTTDKPGFSKYQCGSTGCGAIQYTTNYYTVKFLTNGGSPNPIDEQTVTYTEGVALTEMTRTGYTFKGWQKYSGADSNNNTNTDPLINGNTEYFRFATNMLAGYNDNNMVVTLIAIWQHDHPTDTVDKVSITGGVSANTSNPSGVGTAYYCNPKSIYTVTQRTVNNTSPYYVSSNGIEVVNASSGITLENATDFADSQTVAGEFIVHTLTSNATIKSTNNDGVIKLQPYSIRTCNWADTTRSCTSCKNVRTNGNQTALMFDGNAPLEDTINPLIAEWESPTGINYHYEQLNGRTLTIKATDIIGTYYSGLDASVCSIVLEGSDGSTRTLSKTPTTDVYGRITDYTFETFTIDETTPFFADGFKITWNFTDRVGNNSPTSKGSYKFNGFTVGITEFGSYTYQTETSDFTKGEAVYVKIKTTGYTDALNIKVPYDNVQYVYYTDKTDAFVLENAHTENLILNASNTIDIMSYKTSGGVNRPGYINIDGIFGDDKPEHEFYFIFIIPEDSTNTTGTVTVTGTKKALGTTMTKTDSRNFTIDTSTYITEGLHTIIRRTN